jgi:hypothetical protein
VARAVPSRSADPIKLAMLPSGKVLQGSPTPKKALRFAYGPHRLVIGYALSARIRDSDVAIESRCLASTALLDRRCLSGSPTWAGTSLALGRLACRLQRYQDPQ